MALIALARRHTSLTKPSRRASSLPSSSRVCTCSSGMLATSSSARSCTSAVEPSTRSTSRALHRCTQSSWFSFAMAAASYARRRTTALPLPGANRSCKTSELLRQSIATDYAQR